MNKTIVRILKEEIKKMKKKKSVIYFKADVALFAI